MFNWLKGKRKQAEPADRIDEEPEEVEDDSAGEAATTPQAANALIAQWDAKLAEMQARHQQVVDGAVRESEALIAQLQGTDLGPLTRLWGPVEAAKHKHTDEVSDAWDEISDQLAEVDDLPDEVMDREGNKRDIAHTEIEIIHERGFRQVMAKAAQAVYAIDPVMVAGSAIHVGQWKAQSDWEEMTRTENEINSYRESKDVPMSLLERHHAAAGRYWRTVIETEAELVPANKPHVAAKIERYLKDVEKFLRQHWQWRERGK